MIFNYPGSHEGGYRRGRAGESWRADNQPRNMAEVKLIKNRKWPPIIVVITQQLIYCWSMVKLDSLSGVTISRTLEMIEAWSGEGQVSIVSDGANTVCPVTEWTMA